MYKLFILLLLILLIAPIFQLIYGIKYFNNNECDNDRLIKPSVWLIISGSVSIIITLSTIICLLIYKEVEHITIHILSILSSLYSICWVIIGSIMLWRDNIYCGPSSFHDLLWATIIIDLIITSNTVFRSYYKYCIKE